MPLMAALEPDSTTFHLTLGCSSVKRVARAWTTGSAPPPPLALYSPLSGSGVGAAGVPLHAAMSIAMATATTSRGRSSRLVIVVSTPAPFDSVMGDAYQGNRQTGVARATPNGGRGTLARVNIGPVRVPPPGQSIAGSFTFAGDEGLQKYQWPFIAIAGNIAGPTVLITAGIHAAEYTGIEAAIRLGQAIAPDSVRGTIVILPILNRPGFFERSIYVNPEDNDNLNRLFPGKPDGTWGERFAHRLLTEVITKAEHAMDLHAG